MEVVFLECGDKRSAAPLSDSLKTKRRRNGIPLAAALHITPAVHCTSNLPSASTTNPPFPFNSFQSLPRSEGVETVFVMCSPGVVTYGHGRVVETP